MIQKNGNIIAICYLGSPNDTKNMCLFTNQELQITTHGTKEVFQNEEVKNIIYRDKRLLIPVVVGGIGGSLGLVALFMNLYNPWLLMILVTACGLWFYYGWQGLPAIVIQTAKGEHSFIIPRLTDNIKMFFTYFQALQPGSQHRKSLTYFYAIINKQKWETKDSNQWDLIDADLNTYQQVVETCDGIPTDYVVLVIDPLEIRQGIRFEKDDKSGQIKPKLKGQLPLHAVVECLSGSDINEYFKNQQ